MNRSLALSCVAMLTAAPAFAQEASPPIDWDKPVIYDAPLPKPAETYTVAECASTIRVVDADSGAEIAPDPEAEAAARACAENQKDKAMFNLIAGHAAPQPAPSVDPLAGYSPEMREKLSRFLPKPKQE